MVLVSIEGIKISNLTFDIIIPDVIHRIAEFSYYIEKNDEGQILVDKAIYNENEVREYTFSAGAQTWICDGKISKYVFDDSEHLSKMIIYLDLCGKFKYVRGDTLIVERDFSDSSKNSLSFPP